MQEQNSTDIGPSTNLGESHLEQETVQLRLALNYHQELQNLADERVFKWNLLSKIQEQNEISKTIIKALNSIAQQIYEQNKVIAMSKGIKVE